MVNKINGIKVFCFALIIFVACNPDTNNNGGNVNLNPSNVGNPSQVTSNLQSIANDLVAKYGITGMVVSIKDRNGVVTSAAAHPGSAIIQWVDVNKQFRIGSISKMFTATLLLMLQDENLINIDQPVLPSGVTTRMLLNHTGATGDYITNPQLMSLQNCSEPPVGPASSSQPYLPYQVWTMPQLISFSLVNSIPGIFAYSNTGYMIAGKQAEYVGRVPADPNATPHLNSLMASRIFIPLGMVSTVFQETFTKPINLVSGYDVFSDCNLYDVTNIEPSLFNSAGSICTTASDLHIFLSALFGGKLVSKSGLQQMLTTVPMSQTSYYGLGIKVEYSPTGKLIYYHDGAVPGYESLAIYYPASGISIVILVNTYTTPWSTSAINEAYSIVDQLVN